MKKTILILMIFISLAFGRAGGQKINTFIKFLAFDTLAAGAGCIAATPDGNYIIAGDVGGQWALANADAWIIKIKPSGDTIWTRRTGGNGMDMSGTIIVHDNNYIAIGFKSVFLSGRQGWLLEYDANGKKIADKTYGGSQDDVFSDIIYTGNENFLAIGQTKSYTTNNTPDAWLVKLNSSFDTAWTKHYDLGAITGDTSREDAGNGIMAFGINKYLITVNTCKLCNGTDGIAWYAVIDSNGNIIGSPHVFNKGPRNVFAGGIRPTADSGAIITGATSMKDSVILLNFLRSEDIWILKLNSNADTIWTKIYGTKGIYDGGFSIYQTDDGGYFMSAYSQTGDTPDYNFDNVWLMRLDSKGDTIKVCRWGGPKNDDLLNIIPALDGGAIGVGCYNSNSYPLAGPIPGQCDILIIKTDCNIINGIPVIPEEDRSLIIYPNPANEFINIQVPYETNNKSSVYIYNAIGEKLVAYKNITKNIITVNITNFPKGIYLVQFVNESGKFAVRKLIVE